MKNRKKAIIQYTELVARRLYNIPIKVYFANAGEEFLAIFRLEKIHPWVIKEKDYDDWINNNMYCSITFNSGIFFNKEIPPHTFNTIVHEVSHYEIGINSYKNFNLYHSKEFKKLEKFNLLKVKDLRKEFWKEVQ